MSSALEDLGLALNAGVPFTIGGKEWLMQPLDVFDLIALEREMRAILPADVVAGLGAEGDKRNAVDLLDFNEPGHAILIFWLVLRKSDPGLSDDDRAMMRYRLTLSDARAIIGRPEVYTQLDRITIASGLYGASKAASPEGKGQAEKNAPRRSSRRRSGGDAASS